MEPLLERLARGEIIVGDGAWGTQLMERGLEPGDCPEAFNLERPGVLTEVASLYLEAGAEILTTNTFGGSPHRLASYGLEDRSDTVNRVAVQLLREVAGDRAYVSASVGPSGVVLKPYGDAEPETVHASFLRQIRALVDAGADAICIETMIDLEEALLAVRAARAIDSRIPLMATMTFDATPRGFFTVMGAGIERAAAELERAGADVIGSNCGNGIERMVEIARALREHSSLPLAIRSNAGLPQNLAGEVVYPESPAYMAERVDSLIDVPVSIIGGCCGTTPEHVRRIRARVERHRPADHDR